MSWIRLHENDDEVLCGRCDRPISEHRIFHDEPPPGHGLTEATFGVDTSGFYCPPSPDEP